MAWFAVAPHEFDLAVFVRFGNPGFAPALAEGGVIAGGHFAHVPCVVSCSKYSAAGRILKAGAMSRFQGSRARNLVDRRASIILKVSGAEMMKASRHGCSVMFSGRFQGSGSVR